MTEEELVKKIVAQFRFQHPKEAHYLTSARIAEAMELLILQCMTYLTSAAAAVVVHYPSWVEDIARIRVSSQSFSTASR